MKPFVCRSGARTVLLIKLVTPPEAAAVRMLFNAPCPVDKAATNPLVFPPAAPVKILLSFGVNRTRRSATATVAAADPLLPLDPVKDWIVEETEFVALLSELRTVARGSVGVAVVAAVVAAVGVAVEVGSAAGVGAEGVVVAGGVVLAGVAIAVLESGTVIGGPDAPGITPPLCDATSLANWMLSSAYLALATAAA
jgi:hypothetical protein